MSEIGPRWLGRLGITIEQLEEPQMCDEKMAVVGRAAGRKAQREHDARVAADAVRAFQNGAPRTARTDKARNVLAVVGVLFVMASMSAIVHAVVIILTVAAVVGLVALLAFVTRGLHLPRRRRHVMPAPDPVLTGRVRTQVESVTVQPAIRPAAARGAVRQAGSATRRVVR